MRHLWKGTLSLLAVAAASGFLIVAGGMAQESGQPLRALGGEKVLDDINAAPDVEKQSVPSGGFARAYRQQPPLVPHRVDTYQIDHQQCLHVLPRLAWPHRGEGAEGVGDPLCGPRGRAAR